MNTIAYRGDLTGDPNFKELLAQIKGKALQGQENQDVPFEKIVEVLQPFRSTSHSSIFQTMFTWIENETVSYNVSCGILEKKKPIIMYLNLILHYQWENQIMIFMQT